MASVARLPTTDPRGMANHFTMQEFGVRFDGSGESHISPRVEGGLNGRVASSANSLLADYYRCPSALLPPFLLAGPPAQDPGYFRLGPDIVCYGPISWGDSAKHPVGNLEDALDHVRLGCDGIELPFDAGEVVENLRRERYTAHFRQEGRALNECLRKVYYFVRPLLGVPVRRHLQKMHLRGWKDIPFPNWPVDATVERIHQKLLALSLKAQGITEIPFVWFWPEGLSSCAILTHDVEDPAGKDFCAEVMDMDESAGLRSSFQLVPENRYPVTSDFRDSITSRGFEVNVHDLKHDGRLYAEHDEFLRRAKRINDYAREYGAAGFRSGILYRNADWYDAFEFSYDMSIPNVAHLDPQRGGSCTVMPYFIGKMVELPLTCTQDYTLFQILGDYSIDLWKEQIALVREHHGLISFIVHPDYIQERRAQNTYKSLLDYLAGLLAEDHIWTALPRDVADWWKQRSQMHLVLEGGQWCVEGPGKERARVAYAALTGDQVTYSLADQTEGVAPRG